MLIRPATMEDHAQILALAEEAGIGMLSLPPNPDVLEKKIAYSQASFAGNPPHEKEEQFLFVMEDTQNGKLAGTTGIMAHVGLTRPFYSYKLSTLVQASEKMGIYSHQQVLHMVNDYTGATEIGSLFLSPDYRRDGLGRFLSRCRYLMMAEFPDLFADIVIAEIRGVTDAAGDAPFYDHLARHFFKMRFVEADTISATKGNQFIADLMPKYPIYVTLLPQEAQAVIGKPLPASEAAMKLLIREGFSYEGYMDVFDAGPTMQAERGKIRAIQNSRKGTVGKTVPQIDDDNQFMISNSVMDNFRIVRDAMIIEPDGSISLSESTAEKLKVNIGDGIRYSPT